MDQILTQFQGFHPTEFTRSHLDSTLSEIHLEAPHGAILKAVFKRQGKTFSASVKITSAAGQFFVTAQGPHVREVSHKLIARVRKQMKRWKALRMQRQSLRDFHVA